MHLTIHDNTDKNINLLLYFCIFLFNKLMLFFSITNLQMQDQIEIEPCYSCVFGKGNYRVLFRVCLCVCVFAR